MWASGVSYKLMMVEVRERRSARGVATGDDTLDEDVVGGDGDDLLFGDDGNDSDDVDQGDNDDNE